MTPANFNESNCVLDRPGDMSADQCDPLCVWRGAVGDTPVVISCWKMTPDELAEITRTGRVWLMLVGHTMQPASVLSRNPVQRAEAT